VEQGDNTALDQFFETKTKNSIRQVKVFFLANPLPCSQLR
jgi:hypothetical protein